MRLRLLVAIFLASAGITASQPACIVPFECINYTLDGFLVCGRLEPVSSQGRAGEIEITDDFGLPPEGCTCMFPDTESIWLDDPLALQLDPLYEQMQEDARIACEELAIKLEADPTPCDAALIDKTTATKSEGTTPKCPFTVEQSDEDKDGNCPPLRVRTKSGSQRRKPDRNPNQLMVDPRFLTFRSNHDA